ncbi:MAG TPA: FCD domain-containing protein [Candidatus Limnocylindria bacterium]|nr:FCD domain-containing protein [Candidatus Limnocylindria bacterium]
MTDGAAPHPAPSVSDDSGGHRDAGRTPFRGEHLVSQSAAEAIAGQVRGALIEGRLQPGDRLATEPEMAEDFGVSRSTVREAIRILRGQGFVQTVRGAKGGHFVVTPQTDVVAESVGETLGLWFEAGTVSVAEVDEARNLVEAACVRLAAERRTEEDLRAMEDVLADAAVDDQPLRAFLDHDVRFHRCIARAARNRLLELPMTAIHLIRPRTNVLLRRHDRETVRAQHRQLYEAIRDGDADAAEAAFRDHASYIAEERAAAAEERQRRPTEIAVRELPELSDGEHSAT